MHLGHPRRRGGRRNAKPSINWTKSAGNRHRPASDRPVRVNAASPPDRYAATHRRVERIDTPALAAASGNATP
jgi:hypothetical protein